MNRLLSLILVTALVMLALSGICFAENESFRVYNDFNTEQNKFGFTDISSSSSLSYVWCCMC